MYTELFDTLYPINTPSKGRGVAVTAVDPFALAYEIGIKVGDRILKVNEREVRDFIDWQYYTGSEDRVSLEIQRKSGELWNVDVEVGEGEVWGIDLEHFAPRQCANDCIFCFCNQNPPGSRESLFFKDEDTRLSFLHGNYTTMSSISKLELDRIVEQRLSPQYVSVHATDPEVRRFLLGRKRADDVLAKMEYLSANGIELHAQIVLCPTINDGDVLRRTITDLAKLHPGLRSVAIVPVVFTRLHNYRHLMNPVTDHFARELIRDMESVQRECRSRLGSTFAFLADEFYLRARHPLPERAHYGNYPQIEDGVGMTRRFLDESRRTLKRVAAKKQSSRGNSPRGTVVTGELFYPVLRDFVERLDRTAGIRVKPLAVQNRFFGEEVTVAGLMTGVDLLAARDGLEGEVVIVPEQACLKEGRIFLDDSSLEDLGEELGRPVVSGGSSASSLFNILSALPRPEGLT